MPSKFATIALFNKTCQEQKLQGWRLLICTGDQAGVKKQNTMGQCQYNTRTLWVSEALLTHGTWAEVKDTLMHEIAHACAGPHAGHGPAWKSWAKRLGANPARYNTLNKLASGALAKEPRFKKPRAVQPKDWVLTAFWNDGGSEVWWTGKAWAFTRAEAKQYTQVGAKRILDGIYDDARVHDVWARRRPVVK